MLSLHKRHTKKCSYGYGPHDRSGKKCGCVIHVSGTLKGESIRQSLHTRDWAAASRILIDAEARGSWDKGTKAKSVLEAYDAFLADASSEKGRALKPATIGSYQTLRRKLELFLAARKITNLCAITPENIRQFRDSLPTAPRSTANYIVKLSCVMRFAVQNEWLDKNPCDSVKRPRASKDEDSQKQPFSKEEMEKIFAGAAADPELTTLIWVMRTTGLRISDAVFLHRNETSNGNLRVKTRKSGAVVTMPLEPHVYKRLCGLSAAHGDYYFVDADTRMGTGTDLYRRKMNRIFRSAKIQKATPHRFRHTAAVGWFLAGLSTESVARLLGHSSPAITAKFYSAWSQARVDALSEEVKKTWGNND